jgi:hypothetical protein
MKKIKANKATTNFIQATLYKGGKEKRKKKKKKNSFSLSTFIIVVADVGISML